VQTLTDRKQILIEFFQLIGQGRMKETVRFFSPDCKQHNPYIRGGVDALLDAMVSAARGESGKHHQPEFKVVNMAVDGDVAIVHTNLLSDKNRPDQGGLRQAHVFRFKADKIVEYWDITQSITPEMPNAGNAF
jgi:predicted SnoaL-like aldol condensation-catalyzing enzyme